MMIRLANKLEDFDADVKLLDEASGLIEELNVESDYLRK